MLDEQRRILYKHRGAWYCKPVPAAYGLQVRTWEEGMSLVFGPWEVFIDWYSSNLLC